MTNNGPIRVLLVDDSAFVRVILSKLIDEAPDLQVIGHARDGQQALKLIPELNPDVVTLDVEMPRMDGLTTLKKLMHENPRPVIMISTLTKEGAQETIKALTYGAVDFVAKPDSQSNIASVRDELLTKIRQAAGIKLRSISRNGYKADTTPPPGNKSTLRFLRRENKVIVIGSSTGGPRALKTVLSKIPADIPAAFLIVQHMPAGFTKSLAERMNDASAIQIRQAENGDQLKVGLGLVAPGGFHMKVNKNGEIHLTSTPPIHGVRPAVDATLTSVAQYYPDRSVAVILTGMGSDGSNGTGLIRGAGGFVITEDESTCVVWGMPRSVCEAGYSNLTAPIDTISDEIIKIAF